MRKKIVAVLAAALMLFSAFGALTGCANSKKTITIVLLTNQDERSFYIQYFKDMEKELKEEGHDYKLKFNGYETGDYYNYLGGALQRNDVPDIFYLRPNEIMQYKNHIVSLQDFADEYGDPANENSIANLSDIYENALNMYRYNATTGELGNPNDPLYAFPKDLSVQQLGYNVAFLKRFEEEIKAEGHTMPWDMKFDEGKTYTWDEYLEICQIIEKSENKKDDEFASDVPSVEILARSFAADPTAANAGALIDLSNGRKNGKVNDIAKADSPIKKAIEYQARLTDCGAANYENATFTNFTAGKVGFYGLTASWEISQYNSNLGEGNWEIMPWPTVDGGANWYGLITSAGYVVSKKAAGMEKGNIAKRIAMSFMSDRTQERMVEEAKICIPLRKSVESAYRNSANNSKYSPSTRGFYVDVIKGTHGFFPAKYSTYDEAWLDKLSDALAAMWNEGKNGYWKKYESTKWADIQEEMQTQYDLSKND